MYTIDSIRLTPKIPGGYPNVGSYDRFGSLTARLTGCLIECARTLCLSNLKACKDRVDTANKPVTLVKDKEKTNSLKTFGHAILAINPAVIDECSSSREERRYN